MHPTPTSCCHPARRAAAALVLLPALGLAAPHAGAQLTPFLGLYNPVGVAADAAGNLFVSHDDVTATLVSKFAPGGQHLGSVRIGGFVDVGALGALATTANGTLLLLLNDGRLVAIDPNTLAPAFLFDLRTLPAQTSAIYDVVSGIVSGFGGVILPQFSTFGDLAILQRGTQTDLLVTALSQAQAFAYVLRVRLQGNTIVDARVLMSSNAETVTDRDLRQSPRLTRGIAVNRQGTVLTTLPYAIVRQDGTTTTPTPFDVAVAFPVDFDPADGVQAGETPVFALPNTLDLYSQGMTTDAAGNFYVVTNASGSAALGVAGEGILAVLPATLGQVASVASLGQPLTNFRDVAAGPRGDRVFVSVDLFSVGPAQDVVVTAPLASGVATEPGPPAAEAGVGHPYPNPFGDEATLTFTSAETGHVRAVHYDPLGRARQHLFDGPATSGVTYRLRLEGTTLPGGVYTVRVQGPGGAVVRPVVKSGR